MVQRPLLRTQMDYGEYHARVCSHLLCRTQDSPQSEKTTPEKKIVCPEESLSVEPNPYLLAVSNRESTLLNVVQFMAYPPLSRVTDLSRVFYNSFPRY